MEMYTAQGITANAGATVTQGSASGTLKTAVQNEWTMAITSQVVNENAGVTVSQNEWTLGRKEKNRQITF